ncbi:MAG: ribosome small subunit-dependent GTPase A [Burkholderiales bacterium]|nr:ribosome small subunit-dependent GTPase A [Burkholderiales bacterium]
MSAPPRARVVAAHRRSVALVLPDGEPVTATVQGRRLRIAVGDEVELERRPGTTIVVDVVPRHNLFYRSDAFNEKLLAANLTQIAAVVAPDVSVDHELVERWSIAAETAHCRFVVFANKADLPGFATLQARLAPFAARGYAVVALSAQHDAAPALPWLRGERTLLVGQSGMGKSTLVNAVVPGAGVRTAEVSAALHSGRHTTTATTLHFLPDTDRESWLVDSPGVKVFGLAHLDPATLADAFVEMRPYLGRCRFRDCRHDAEPGCALVAAVAAGAIAPHRLALLHTLRREAEAGGR